MTASLTILVMTLVWVVVVAGVVLLVAAFGYVAVRDRRRSSSAEDARANRAATAEAERHAAGRHAQQGTVWDRGQLGPPL